MKLQCSKCSKPLTTDMYQAKVHWFPGWFDNKRILNLGAIYNKDQPIYDYDEEGYEKDQPDRMEFGSFRRGVFYMTQGRKKENNKYDEDRPAQIVRKRLPMIAVGVSSILDDVIPPFKHGHGCCNFSMGEVMNCTCGNPVGHMYLDCYEDGSVHFIEKGVTRVYK